MVEGPVERFVPERADGHGIESFVVSGVQFSYMSGVYDGGFNDTAFLGGPIREGLQVRVYYLSTSRGPKIVQLEVADKADLKLSFRLTGPNVAPDASLDCHAAIAAAA